MSKFFAKVVKWVNDQLKYAKSAWAIIVVIASLLGWNLKLEPKEPKPETPVEDVVPTNPRILVH